MIDQKGNKSPLEKNTRSHENKRLISWYDKHLGRDNMVQVRMGRARKMDTNIKSQTIKQKKIVVKTK